VGPVSEDREGVWKRSLVCLGVAKEHHEFQWREGRGKENIHGDQTTVIFKMTLTKTIQILEIKGDKNDASSSGDQHRAHGKRETMVQV